jgi:N-acetylmuramoyl-L-alanine amidase
LKKQIAALGLVLGIFATGLPKAEALTLNLNGRATEIPCVAYGQTTYLPLRAVSQQLLPGAEVSWEEGRAVVRDDGLELTAVPGALYIEVNGRALYVPDRVKVVDGVTLLPSRVLASALGAEVEWVGKTQTVAIRLGDKEPPAASYDDDALYWLSRIISAESRGESLLGKIAVGNVVLNRVDSPEFPNTIYGVIFDDRWGGQFEPVRNGTVYQEPTQESILAAKLCLEGAVAVEDALYFLAPTLASNFWTMENRPYITTIGVHWFYG